HRSARASRKSQPTSTRSTGSPDPPSWSSPATTHRSPTASSRWSRASSRSREAVRATGLLIDLVESGLEALRVLLDLLVVDRHELDLGQRRVPRRRLDVGTAGVDALARQELLHGVADHELGERLGGVAMR